MKPFIGHVDADCFYVSAERVRRPHLQTLPVGVLGNHGACIIAKSYEAKAAGVTTGMPIWDAQKLCQNMVYIKRDFQWYETLSRRMLNTVQSLSDRVEYYSVDEMFFASPTACDKAAKEIRDIIFSRVGIPSSVGIAPTKTLAKLASDRNKPFGFCAIINEKQRKELLQDLPVTEVTGIAEKSRHKLEQINVKTCDQFVAADRRLIRKVLTKKGEDLWWELRGEAVLPIATQRPQHKKIARGGSLGRATADAERLRAFVTRNVERLTEAMRFYQVYCDRLTLDLSFRPRGRAIKHASFSRSAADFATLNQAACYLLCQIWSGEPVHYMHVIASKLRHKERQASLWDHPTQKRTNVDALRHKINAKLGRFAVRSGATTTLDDVYEDPANDYDICDIHGKSCF